MQRPVGVKATIMQLIIKKIIEIGRVTVRATPMVCGIVLVIAIAIVIVIVIVIFIVIVIVTVLVIAK